MVPGVTELVNSRYRAVRTPLAGQLRLLVQRDEQRCSSNSGM